MVVRGMSKMTINSAQAKLSFTKQSTANYIIFCKSIDLYQVIQNFEAMKHH